MDIPTWATQRYKRWCKKHITGYWGINPHTGKHYAKCSKGFLLNEECEVGNPETEEAK